MVMVQARVRVRVRSTVGIIWGGRVGIRIMVRVRARISLYKNICNYKKDS
jgi:hypothetical protein